MYRAEVSYFVVLAIVILLSQLAPSKLLLLLDNAIVRASIVLFLLYLVHIGPTAGIFGLMAICILYLERNRYKVALAVQKLDMMDTGFDKHATVQEAAEPQKSVPVQPFDHPNTDISDYLPHEGNESSGFEPVAPTINQKAVLSSIYPSGSASGSDTLFEKLGFGHLDGVETHGDAQ